MKSHPIFKGRYIPDLEWSFGKSYIHDVFRVFEWIFGRKYGIRCESSTRTYIENGCKIVFKKFYTIEAVLAHAEVLVRDFLSQALPVFEWVELPQVQLAGFGRQSGEFKIPIFTFAIATDAGSDHFTASGTTDTSAHTCTGSDRALLVTIFKFGGADSVTGVTYNSTAQTRLGAVSSDASGYTYVYGKEAPSTGANNIVSTSSSSVQWFVTAESYTGVDQTTPFPQQNSGSSSASSFTASVTTTVNNSWLYLGGRSPSKSPTAGTDTVVRRTNAGSGDAAWILDSNAARATGSNSLAWSYAGASFSYWVLTSIAPSASASGPANLKSYNTNLAANIKSINTNPIANVKSLNTNV